MPDTLHHHDPALQPHQEPEPSTRTRAWCTTARCRPGSEAQDAAGTGPASELPTRGRRAEPGSLLCGRCRQALLRDLAALPELFDESERYLQAGNAGGPVQRLTGSRTESMPVDGDALEARHQSVVRLAAWVRTAVEAVPSAIAPSRTVAAMAPFLLRHVDRMAAHPAAGRLADEIARAAAALRRLGGPGHAALVVLGHCVEPGCEAEVTLPRRSGADLVLRGPSCAAGHVLSPRQWLELKDAA